MYPITNKTRSFHGSQFENGCQRLGNPESESKQHTTENKMESAMLVAFRPATMKNMDGSPRYASNHTMNSMSEENNLPYLFAEIHSQMTFPPHKHNDGRVPNTHDGRDRLAQVHEARSLRSLRSRPSGLRAGHVLHLQFLHFVVMLLKKHSHISTTYDIRW